MRRMKLTARILYLSRKDVESVGMEMAEVIRVVEEALLEKGQGRVEMPPKPAISTAQDAFIHAMPAYVPKLKAAGMKWISGYPGNYKLHLPYISGLIILNDPESGFPEAVLDATWVTAARTGAATAVAAKYLAREDATSAAILGCGVQGRTNLEALKTQLPNMERAHAYDVLADAAGRYAEEMAERLEMEVIPCSSPRKAVEASDVVVTATPILKNPDPVIEEDWLIDGSFSCPLDFDSSFKGSAFRAMDKLYTDDVQQQRHFREEGYFRDMPEPDGDLGDILAGRKPGREGDRERTMSVNLGLAIEDVSVARRICQAASENGIGTYLVL